MTGRFIRINKIVARKYMPIVWARNKTMLFGFKVVENIRKNFMSCSKTPRILTTIITPIIMKLEYWLQN